MPRDPLENPGPLIRSVYAYVAYRIGDGADAEDITSETFARAVRYRGSYDRRKGEPVAWLIAIARRCIIDAVRPSEERDRSALPNEEQEGSASLSDPADLETDAVRRLTLWQAVAELDERERELVALRFGADLTARRIAELTDRKTHAVEVALQRTLQRLRDRLDESDRAAAESDHVASVRFSADSPVFKGRHLSRRSSR